MLYHVNGAVVLSQGRVSSRAYDVTFTSVNEYSAAIFADYVRLRCDAWLSDYATYEFILDVSENQPAEESVEEITNTGVAVAVYNENGVLVCRNVPKTTANGAPAQTVVPGEMTSEPIDGTGEMASEPI